MIANVDLSRKLKLFFSGLNIILKEDNYVSFYKYISTKESSSLIKKHTTLMPHIILKIVKENCINIFRGMVIFPKSGLRQIDSSDTHIWIRNPKQEYISKTYGRKIEVFERYKDMSMRIGIFEAIKSENRIHFVKYAIQAGFDPHTIDEHGYSLIDLAAMYCNEVVRKALLRIGCVHTDKFLEIKDIIFYFHFFEITYVGFE